jgi:hypothetical protein
LRYAVTAAGPGFIGFIQLAAVRGHCADDGVISILSIVTLAAGCDGRRGVAAGQHPAHTRHRPQLTFVLGTGVPALNAFLLG